MDGIQPNKFVTGVNNLPYVCSTSPIRHDNRQKDVKDGDKKSMNALKWAGIIAAGALAVGGVAYAIKKGQMPKYERITDEAGKTIQKVGGKVLTYDKGVAMLDGKKAEGILKFTTNKGVTLTYNNGVLQSSIKAGKDGFEKLYNKKGLLKKMITVGEDGKNKIIQHVHDRKTGKILKIKNKLGDTLFNYDSNGKLTSAFKNGDDLVKKAHLNEINNYIKSKGDLSQAGMLKEALEEKIADGQISNLEEALNSGYTKEQLNQVGLLDKLSNKAKSVQIQDVTSIPKNLSAKQKYALSEIQEKIADGQISNLEDALNLGYSQDLLKALGFLK